MATPLVPTLSRSWKLNLDGGEHIVELEYTLFDMAIARLDGQTVGRTWKFWRVASSGADFRFRVAGHDLIGTIRPIDDARQFQYELFLDGRSLDSGAPYRPADARPGLINVALTFLPVIGVPTVLSGAVRSRTTDGTAWVVTIALAIAAGLLLALAGSWASERVYAQANWSSARKSLLGCVVVAACYAVLIGTVLMIVPAPA